MGEFERSALPLSAYATEFNTTDTGDLHLDNVDLANRMFMGNDLFWTSGGSCDYEILADQTLPLNEGLNTFHLPYGEIPADVPTGTVYAIPLTASTLHESGATPGSGLNVSDIIWQIRGGEVSGAWLKDFSQERVNATMCANLKSGRNIFRYPFPGQGVSGEGVPWTGPTTTNCKKPVLVAENIERLENAINQKYWQMAPVASAADPLSLHLTTLVDAGAFPSTNFFEADKIVTRPTPRDNFPDGVYNGEENHAFLYNFTHTELPILPGSNDIYFPLHRYEDIKDIPFQMDPDQTAPVRLATLVVEQDFAGAIAGDTPETADKIFRKQGVCGSRIEGAWLKSCPLAGAGYSQFSQGAVQSSLSFEVQPGEQQRFFWSFPSRGAEEVFVGFEHDEYCRYKKLGKWPSLLENSNQLDPNINFEAWRTCDCKAVYHSPAGHNNSDKEKYRLFADWIVEDEGNLEPFSFGTWTDENGLDYLTSPKFAFAIYSGVEPDVGWGQVSWVTGSGGELTLEEGKHYIYGRAALNSCGEMPPGVVNFAFCDTRENSCRPTWTSLILDSSGDFVDGGEATNMVFHATDILEYDRQETASFTYDSSLDGVSNIQYQQANAAFVWNTCLSANPFWAKAVPTNGLHTHGYLIQPNDYINIHQPSASDITLDSDTYFKYEREVCEPLVWSQPLDFTVSFDVPAQWKTLAPCYVDSDMLSKIVGCSPCSVAYETRTVGRGDPTILSGCDLVHISNTNLDIEVEVQVCECTTPFLTFSATDIDSPLVLESADGCGDFAEFYYNAQQAFTWNQDIRSAEPIVSIPHSSGSYIDAHRPWANRLNVSAAEIELRQDTGDLEPAEPIGLLRPDLVGVQTILSFDDIGFEDPIC